MTAAPHDPPTPDDPSSHPIPGLGHRLGALLVDWLASVLISAAFADPRTSTWPPVAVLVLIHALGVGVFGQTPGMLLTGLRCVSFTQGGAVGVPRGLLRGLLLVLIVPTLVMDDWRRGLHDRAAGTIVITHRRSRP